MGIMFNVCTKPGVGNDWKKVALNSFAIADKFPFTIPDICIGGGL